MYEDVKDSRSGVVRKAAHRSIDRRSVLKVAAWSAPTVALAATLPMASASVDPQLVDLGVTFRGSSLDLFGDMLNGIQSWYDNLPRWQQIAVSVPYGAMWTALTVQSGMLNIGYSFPSHAVVSNIDSKALTPVQTAFVDLDFGAAVLNLGAFDSFANIDAFGTSSGANITVSAVSPTAPGGTVTEIPLTYNPITLQINLAGGSQNPGTAKATLTGDTSIDGNYAESPFGVKLEIFAAFQPLFDAVNKIVPIPPINISIFA